MDRFYAKVKINEKTGCHEWQAAVHHQGYGMFKLDGKNIFAHRAAYSLYHGEIPKGKCVLHRCDNRLCVNPDHLFLGSRTDNAADRDAKGKTLRGEQKTDAKLTEELVRYIRKSKRPASHIAEELGVTSSAISMIRRRVTWKHVI